MSWARFSDSDVYMFPTSDGYECCACSLMPKRWCPERPFLDIVLPAAYMSTTFTTPSVEAFLSHVGHHRTAGHEVPDSVEADVIEWAMEESS